MSDRILEELWHSLNFSEDEPLFLEAGVRKTPWDERRPTAELVRSLFELSALLPQTKQLPESADHAQSYVVGLLRDTRTTIRQLGEEALARAEVHDQTVREVDYQISRAALSLDRFTGWTVGYNTGVDIKRNHLERELSSLRKERRSALVRTWKDIAALRKEFREAVAQYKSLLGRLQLL